MKRTLTLLTGSLLLVHSVTAQSGSPPRYPTRVDIFNFFKTLPLVSLLKPDKPAKDSNIAPWISYYGKDSPINWKPVRHIDPDSLRIYCERLINARRKLFFLTDEAYRMHLQLRGIYACEETIFLQISISNHSNLDFDVDSIQFFITDIKRPAGKLERPQEIFPLYVYGDEKTIKGKSRENSVIALPKFTLPPGKQLIIRVTEKNGGRHLQLQADNFILLKARLA